MHVARTVYEKYQNGDSINDAELTQAVTFFEKLEKDLRAVGPVFKLAAAEAGRVYSVLHGFQEARGHRARDQAGLGSSKLEP